MGQYKIHSDFISLNIDFLSPLIEDAINQVIGYYTSNQIFFEVIDRPENKFFEPDAFICSRIEIVGNGINYELRILTHTDLIKKVTSTMLGKEITDNMIPIQALEDVSGEILNQVGGILVDQLNSNGGPNFKMGLTFPHNYQPHVGTTPRRMWIFRDAFDSESYFEIVSSGIKEGE